MGCGDAFGEQFLNVVCLGAPCEESLVAGCANRFFQVIGGAHILQDSVTRRTESHVVGGRLSIAVLGGTFEVLGKSARGVRLQQRHLRRFGLQRYRQDRETVLAKGVGGLLLRFFFPFDRFAAEETKNRFGCFLFFVVFGGVVIFFGGFLFAALKDVFQFHLLQPCFGKNFRHQRRHVPPFFSRCAPDAEVCHGTSEGDVEQVQVVDVLLCDFSQIVLRINRSGDRLGGVSSNRH